jgi:hypothetical protein
MLSFGILYRVAHVRTDITEEHIASISRVTRIGKLATLALTSNQSMLKEILSISLQHALVASYS